MRPELFLFILLLGHGVTVDSQYHLSCIDHSESKSKVRRVKKSNNIHMLIQLIKMLALLGDGFLQLAEPI